ncbi:MAG TPA: hypothetical protein VMH39_02045, partial [Gemmatimonadaceae bacterium]|nr:hypothetical protein [Gemmatimonadaceae bacterium]
LWDAYWNLATDTKVGPANYTRIVDLLTKTHGFTFTPDESAQLQEVWEAFYDIGPSITTRANTTGRGGGNNSNFADLTGYSLDYAGQVQSFLSTEDNYRTVKALEDKNLVMPISGDFGGPKALKALGAYLTEHGAIVTAFYVSNVEQYLFQDGKQAQFYANVATLPVNDSSVFIRPYALRQYGGPPLCPITAFLKAFDAGRANYYNATLSCVQ